MKCPGLYVLNIVEDEDFLHTPIYKIVIDSSVALPVVLIFLHGLGCKADELTELWGPRVILIVRNNDVILFFQPLKHSSETESMHCYAAAPS